MPVIRAAIGNRDKTLVEGRVRSFVICKTPFRIREIKGKSTI